jgi:CheY-like chemotaxis protein
VERRTSIGFEQDLIVATGASKAFMEDVSKAILCLCDDALMLQVRRLVLEHFGYRVWSADTLENARDIAKAVCPDMVLMDNNFQGLDIERVAEQVKGVCPNVIAVVLTPYYSVRNAKHGAVDHFVARDEEPDSLVAHLRDLLDEGQDGARRQGRSAP